MGKRTRRTAHYLGVLVGSEICERIEGVRVLPGFEGVAPAITEYAAVLERMKRTEHV